MLPNKILVLKKLFIKTLWLLKIPYCFIIFYFIFSYSHYFYFHYVNYPFVYPDIKREISFNNIIDNKLNYIGQNLTQSVYMCQNTTKLLIAVISHVNDFERRMLIRNTWGRKKYNSKLKEAKSEIKFIVGKIKNSDSQDSQLLTEQLIYKDLIMTSINEEYYDLSLKSLAALILFSSICPTTNCLSKSDSDTIINITKMEKLCEQNKLIESIHGFCLKNGLVLRRNFVKNKWNVPEFVYPKERYPDYCRGGNYLLTKSTTIEKILTSLKLIGFFHSQNLQKMPEDVMFTGLAAEYANISRIGNSLFIPCIDENGKNCVNRNNLPRKWISAMIGNKNQKILKLCSQKEKWENCINNILFS